MRRLLLALILSMPAAALDGGRFIPVGGDGLGPLAAHAVVTTPIGHAVLPGAESPGLFVQTGRFGHETGLFFYRPAGRGPNGEPVFAERQRIAHPFDNPYPPSGCVHQTADGAVHALWIEGAEIVHTTLNRDSFAFETKARFALDGLPRGPQHIGLRVDATGAATVFVSVSDGVAYAPAGPSGRQSDYDPYDGRGLWRGGHPYVALYSAPLNADWSAMAAPFSLVTGERETRTQMAGIDALDLGENQSPIVLTGSHYGPICTFAATGASRLGPRRYIVDVEGVAHRHPIIHPSPIAYPGENGALTDIIAGGEGGLYWYRFTGRIADSGNPVYDAPLPVLEQNADLYAGTLPVPNAVDWDGDGDTDIVAGNSEGLVLFFENTGGNAEPAYRPGVPLKAGGAVIHIQPGYAGDIQGPGEARWGYVCPEVVDWDQDGDFDIVLSDSTAKHTLFLNEGGATSPKLALGVPIYYDGLDLYGTWRVKPAAGLMDGRMAYIALDDQDAFRLYWQEDARNVTDGFQLRLDTGEVITANFIHAGGTGRLKINLYDWDRDGVKDLIVGTPRHGSVPNPERGLPQALGLPGSAVLFLRNTGTEAEPRFAWPQLFAYNGEPLFLGQHACGPTVADFGAPEGPGLIVGKESGRLLYYDRPGLSLVSPEY